MKLDEAKKVLENHGYLLESDGLGAWSRWTKNEVVDCIKNFCIDYYREYPDEFLNREVNYGELDYYTSEYPLLMELCMQGDNVVADIADKVVDNYINKIIKSNSKKNSSK